MNRREFLKLSAILAAAASSSTFMTGCITPRYVKPDPLTSPNEKLLLTNASIIDVKNGTIREENRILVQNGKIVDLFYDHETGIVPDYELDLKGAYVLPGLINAHCHISMNCTMIGTGQGRMLSWDRQIERNAEECIKHGVTTVRDMLSYLNGVHELKEKIARRNVVGPRIISSTLLEIPNGVYGAYGLAGLMPDAEIVKTPDEAVDGVKKAADESTGLIKITHQKKSPILQLPDPKAMSIEITTAICEEAARQGLSVALHHVDTEGLEKGLTAGVSTFEHLEGDRELTEDDIARILSKDVCFIPTVSAGCSVCWETNHNTEYDQEYMDLVREFRSRFFVKQITEYCEPDIQRANLKIIKQWSNPDYFDTSHLALTFNEDYYNRMMTNCSLNLMALYNNGVRFGCGNDGGLPFLYPGAMGLEMYFLQRSGMDTADILRMATINNAELLGMENEIGSIEKGKIADFAVFENNLLDTLENAFNPIIVFQDGQLAFWNKI